MISSILKQSVKKLVGKANFDLQQTENSDFGDFTTNAAMVGFDKKQFKSPREFAQELVEKLNSDSALKEIIDKIEIAGPGFINFWLKKDVLINNLIQIDKEKGKYGFSDYGKGKTVIVEYSSPNIAKPFGVGHFRSTIIGDAIANLMQATGWQVLRDNHLGDWGTLFGKMIYAIKKWGDEDHIEKSKNPVGELVALYVKVHEAAEADESLEDEARLWFKKLEDGDSEARRLWQKCIDWSWAEFTRIYSQLGVNFSEEFNDGRGLGESFFEDKMPAVIKELDDKKLLKVGEKGAKLIFFEKDKFPPLMILKADGATLYATRDLATDKYRKEKYDPDLIINEVGNEQSLYFRQVFEVEKLLGWYKEGQRVHVGHGLFLLGGKKMSTRAGKTILLQDLLDEAVNKAEKLNNKDNAVAKSVGTGALKYNDLKRDPKSDIVFDWKEILNMEGNSGPYLQYTFARANSVLEKAKDSKSSKHLLEKEVNLNKDELALLRFLPQFPEVIANAAKNYSANLLANYLYNLAQKFNSFYNSNKIIGSDSEEVRIAITAGVAQVLQNGLHLLGIQTPEKM